MTAAYPFPEELLRIPRRASAVIEASAGTGKTYLLEHLVVDRVLRGDARLDEILVVTFTERATAELVRRLRALITKLVSHQAPAPPGTPEDRCWRLDAAARRRLTEALHAFDRATITTMHGFCQGVLTEHAFAGRRLLAQEHVDSRKIFGDAFNEALRTTLAVDDQYAPYLRAWMAMGKGGLERLEKTIHTARVQRRPWGIAYDEARLRAVLEAYGALRLDDLKAQLRKHADGTTARWTEDRARTLQAIVHGYLEHRDLPVFLAELDDETAKPKYKKDNGLFTYSETRLRALPPGPAADFHARFLAVADAALPLELAAAQMFLPVVEAQLAARKQAAGLYDFDDMLTQVRDALAGPDGPALSALLRQRYRLAVIDEFQDTDAVQWEIFRALFGPDSGRPLYVVGDPKQSIYGFRGADLLAYDQARRQLAGPDGPQVTLARNFRSTPEVVDAYNAILDSAAFQPFFTDGDLYRQPVVAAGEPPGAPLEGPPVVLLAVRPAGGGDVTKLPIRLVRQALTGAMAREIRALREGPSPRRLGDIFVLTRSNVEARQAAEGLREAGIPHVLFNQEGLFETPEAMHVRHLLAAINDPRDRARRLRAYLTPFFGLTLGDLPACAALPGGHPLEEKLFAWQALAEARAWPRLFDRILDDSGVVARELAVGGSARRLTNYLQLFDLLLAEAARTPVTLGDLLRQLTALSEKVTVRAPEEGDVQRIEGERDAVQVMTIHKAKGLEADVVFLFGAFSPFRGQGVRAYERDGQRVVYAGRARRQKVEEALRAEADAEDQRLLYVALTRARRRLYLPFGESQELEREPGSDELYFRVGGAYRHVHQRLRMLKDDGRLRAEARVVPCPAPPDGRAARVREALGRFYPPAPSLTLQLPPDELDQRRRRHAGILVTSYTRMKEARRGTAPPTEILDEVAPAFDDAAEGPPAGQLPGGAAWGTFLHAVLEKVPLHTLTGAPSSDSRAASESWGARPEIRELFDSTLRSHGLELRHRAEAQRLVHLALTAPIAVDAAVPGVPALAGIATAARVAREVEFLFPFPEAAGGAARGFVKGYIDVVFEHAGRTYFADWKSDLLPGFAPETLAAHVAESYELQRRLYTMALVKMLGIADRADYEARFGGTAFVFLRGLPGSVELRRPGWDELGRWQTELGKELA